MKLFFLLVTFFISHAASAQSLQLEIPILAKDLPDGMGRGLVYRAKDSTLVKGSYIDSNIFRVQYSAKAGEAYYVRLTAPGFSDTLISFVANPPLMQFNTVTMVPDVMLDAINVVYEKPVFERTMNGLSVNVKGTTLEQLNTLFDVLKSSPKLSSPDDESIEIIGRGVPLILIDRQPIISNDELKAIPASEVDKIEILTNPSAKYRAQGSGNGVIEVYTNNFTLQGYRAHVRADGGVNTEKKYRSGTNVGLNVKKGKFSLNGNGGLSYWQSYNYGNSSFSTLDSSLYSNSNYENNGERLWRHYTFKMGYDINDSMRLSFGVGGHGSSGNNLSNSFRDYYTLNNLTTDRSGEDESRSKWLNSSAFVNYSWDTDSLGSALEVNLNYTRRVSDNENQFQTVFYDYTNQSNDIYDALATSRDRPNIGEVRLNYEHYIDSQFIFEVGGDVSALINEKRFNRYTPVNSEWVEDPVFTNSYNYQEQIAGLFTQISKKWETFGFQIGIRGEYTRLDGYSESLQQQFMDSSYVLPFPNAGILFEPSEKLAVTAYYSSGIDRPSFSNYDPFVRVLDSMNVQFGNPFLRPSYNHTVGLELDLFYAYNISFSYSRYNDIASMLTFIDPQSYVTSSSPWNAKLNETYSVSLSLPINLDWLDGWNSFWLDYNTYEFTDIFQRDPFQNVTFGFHSYLTFSLPQNFKLMNRFFLNRWGNDLSTNNVNTHWAIRLTKEFDKPDLNVFLEVNELLPNQNNSETINGNYLSRNESQSRFTGMRVGLFFKFGKLTANTSIKESESGQSGRF